MAAGRKRTKCVLCNLLYQKEEGAGRKVVKLSSFFRVNQRMRLCSFYLFLALMLGLAACTDRRKAELTPWGTPVGGDTASVDALFRLSDILGNGELIMLTLSGPETYYDYHSRGMGLHYLLCERFAQKLGVSLRVELCKDTTEMIRRLNAGEADIIAFPLPRNTKGVRFCGVSADSLRTQWAVKPENEELADTLRHWFKPVFIAQVLREEAFLLSARSVKRHVYAPMLNKSGGVISHYDSYFRRYAPIARLDWRLMAAQCYQESTFDPQARSWAGASGLMQIMPSTARHLGLAQRDIFDPEANIAAAARYLAELGGHFQDITNPQERMSFILAGYNGGPFHIRDAMRLAQKHGRNPQRWAEVATFVLKLQQPEYYRDAVVKYGYMRGSETVDYVERIHNRWAQYRGVAPASGGQFGVGGTTTPRRAAHRNRFSIK